MGMLEVVRARLRRKPVDLERVRRRAEADARRRAVRDQHGASGFGGGGWVDGGGVP